MPIKQSRILALLSEARAYQRAYNTLRDDIRALVLQQQSEPSPDFFSILEVYLAAPAPSGAVIDAETLHFAREGRRNERERLRMKQKRLNATRI